MKRIGLLVLFGCIGLPTGVAGAGIYEEGVAAEAEGRGAEARAHYERAAQSGSGRAARRLGEMYSSGTAGLSRDYAKSLAWHNLARLLAEEPPPGVDPVRAFEEAKAREPEGKDAETVELYRRAARAGSTAAMLRLGHIYEHGALGRQRDYAAALKWYHAARVLGADVPLKKP